ncbi:ADP-dependent NAD(P)H-hydrate dehydratase [Leucobacter sp. M11]|uniref:ADP-dependent NAD(P)H-hydrate dehydratase n=1 Tax=Leucobacter sp. M11 TaxID=2993565 RepID=UPI002D7FBAF2|nr:ADP/ATP-dependent (S)-NAD(P)H-hydrate dehydratase [Leucobacter sp. M11]MEB4615624.1 NAD(P)H-hydrate dehydratase [Leucobacter sp. M11]
MSVIEWHDDLLATALRAPRPEDDKYSRGVLGIVTGSAKYPGAAVLGVEAALRTGPGMVRFLGDAETARAVLARRPEAVTADGRVQALLVGSGTDATTRSPGLSRRVRDAHRDGVPLVLDAGALGLVRELAAEEARPRTPVILTPHARELSRLLAAADDPGGTGEDAWLATVLADPARAAQRAAERFGAIVLLKGSRTIVAAPGIAARRLPAATPWLASAGTGDVLAGILGTLLAGAQADAEADAEAAGTVLALERLRDLAGAAARVHALTAERVSGGGPLLALELAEGVSRTIAAVAPGRC